MPFWTILWGTLFILIGTAMILKAFGVNIPLFKIAFAFFFIFIGIKILIPGKWIGCNQSSTGRDTLFAESIISGPDVSGKYSVVFGSNKIDLTGLEIKEEDVKINVDVVFGASEIRVDSKKPVKISSSAVFGAIEMPGGNASVFGTSSYTSDSYKEGEPHILIGANVVFGAIEIKKD